MISGRLALELSLERHGVVLPIAALLLVGTAWLSWMTSSPLDAEVARARQEAFEIEQRLSTMSRSDAQPAAAGPSDSLTAFETALASTADRDRLVAQLWSSAAANAVRLSKIDFRTESDVPGGFVRLHMRMPAAGRYPQIKSFAFGLMAAYPSLALQRLEIRRSQPSQADVEATLHLVLLMRP